MYSNILLDARPSIVQSETEQISVEFAYSKPHNSISLESTRRESESVDILSLITQLSGIDERLLFSMRGYKKMNKISDTLQGELYKALILNNEHENAKYVAIKKTEKRLFNERIAIEENINFCVSEDICKEASILKYLTIENKPIGDYIVKYVDFFESETDYYLVVEYIESEMNLKQFISESKKYIENGELCPKQYQKVIKYLLWQLFVTIQWLHISMQCCHLDICCENIMIHCDDKIFISTKNGFKINANICIKVCDFGVAELFGSGSEKNVNASKQKQQNVFLCDKSCLSLQNGGYSAPKVFNGDVYDARAADDWMLGMVLFECFTGQHLYKPLDIHKFGSGRWALKCNQLKRYLSIHNLLKYFNLHSFSVLNGLLNINDSQRLNGMDILMHRWFSMYFQKYNKQIIKKFYKKTNSIKR